MLLAILALTLQTAKPLLGLAINVTPKGGIQELTADVQTERQLGLNLFQQSKKWSELEPAEGKLSVEHMGEDIRNGSNAGFRSAVTLQTIDTNNRTVPPDLASESWDSPKMLAREKTLIEAVLKVLPDDTPAIMLGNEVDVYLSIHADEVDPYLNFLRFGRELIHRLKPGLKVGVTTTYTGLKQYPDLVHSLQSGMDLVSMTYYPLANDFSVLPVSEVPADLDRMSDFAKDRLLYVQEVGYPSSELLGSSEEKQKQFVDAVFDWSESHRDRLVGLCFFLLLDLSDDFVNKLTNYYGLKDQKFAAYLATLGFEKNDATPKLAWPQFQQRAKKFQGSG